MAKISINFIKKTQNILVFSKWPLWKSVFACFFQFHLLRSPRYRLCSIWLSVIFLASLRTSSFIFIYFSSAYLFKTNESKYFCGIVEGEEKRLKRRSQKPFSSKKFKLLWVVHFSRIRRSFKHKKITLIFFFVILTCCAHRSCFWKVKIKHNYFK